MLIFVITTNDGGIFINKFFSWSWKWIINGLHLRRKRIVAMKYKWSSLNSNKIWHKHILSQCEFKHLFFIPWSIVVYEYLLIVINTKWMTKCYAWVSNDFSNDLWFQTNEQATTHNFTAALKRRRKQKKLLSL